MSNLKVAVLEQEKKGNVQCSRCFPHGVDQKNNRQSKVQRSWKEQRKKQYKKIIQSQLINKPEIIKNQTKRQKIKKLN